MIIFDASYLVVMMYPRPEVAKDRENKPVLQFVERVANLAANLDVSNTVIGVPAPAMSEVLVRAGDSRDKYISALSDTWKFQILPFDARAAIEAAELVASVKSRKEKWDTWAKVKFDIQIVATAKAESASLIYSDDKDIENLAKRVNIRVVRICDLPLPPPPEPKPIETGPIGSQTSLALVLSEENGASTTKEGKTNATDSAAIRPSGTTEKNNQLQADPAHPAPVQGSDEGRAQGEATGESKGNTKET